MKNLLTLLVLIGSLQNSFFASNNRDSTRWIKFYINSGFILNGASLLTKEQKADAGHYAGYSVLPLGLDDNFNIGPTLGGGCLIGPLAGNQKLIIGLSFS